MDASPGLPHWVRAAALAAAAAACAGCRAVPPARSEAAAPPRVVPVAGPGGEWVGLLASPDFVARARAAGALVDGGEASLPALGAAGEAIVPAHGTVSVSATRPVIQAILAKVPSERLAAVHLGSPWPTVRRAAAEEAGRRGGAEVEPGLVGRLADADPGVRAAALAALSRWTDAFDGLTSTSPPAVVAGAVARWQASAARPAGPGGRGPAVPR